MTIPINIDDLVSQRIVESSRIEFKAGFNTNPVVHTICAFANDIDNLGGGYIVIGVEEHDGSPILPPKGVPQEQVDGIPLPICRHVASTPLVGNRNAYAVVTMGSFAGIAGRQANKLFASKDMTFKGWAEIAMPKNYIAGPFPEEQPESIEEKIRATPERVAQMADVPPAVP